MSMLLNAITLAFLSMSFSLPLAAQTGGIAIDPSFAQVPAEDFGYKCTVLFQLKSSAANCTLELKSAFVLRKPPENNRSMWGTIGDVHLHELTWDRVPGSSACVVGTTRILGNNSFAEMTVAKAPSQNTYKTRLYVRVSDPLHLVTVKDRPQIPPYEASSDGSSEVDFANPVIGASASYSAGPQQPFTRNLFVTCQRQR